MPEDIRIVPFDYEHIPEKVKWYNDREIRKYLHYEEDFTIEMTKRWLEKIKNDKTRFENVIQVFDNGNYVDIGIIGLFNIDMKNKKAGFYITIGKKEYQGKGLAKKATLKFLKYCFGKFNLEKIFLYTDFKNTKAIRLYEKCGFELEGKLKKELFYNNTFIDRYYYAIFKEKFMEDN